MGELGDALRRISTRERFERLDKGLPYIHPWLARDCTARYRWAIDSYVEGYITKERRDLEIALFEEESDRLIAKSDLLAALYRQREPLTEAQQRRHEEWQRGETERLAKAETRRQRAFLREGHKTLTDLRKMLRRGQAPSQPQASEPARTSPTS